ncbi:MAG: Ig-like domain-containing protein [Blautia glucerasea]|nr:Ig-like domain-containing protein [Blautia glucerasea]
MKKRKIILAMLLCAAMTTGSVLPAFGEDLAAEADVQDVTEDEAFDESEAADFAEFTDQEEVTSDVLDGAFTAYPEESAPVAEDAENPGTVAAQGYYTFDFSDAAAPGVTCTGTMFRVVAATLYSDKEGVMTATITLSGTGRDKLYFGTAEAAEADTANQMTYSSVVKDSNGKDQYVFGPFAVAKLDKVINVAAHSVKGNKWKDYTITFNSSKLLAAATGAVDNSTALPDGTYTPENFTASGGTGKVTITCPQVIVENGKAFADVTFSSKKYVYVKANNQLFNGTVNTSGVTYRIPVDLNEDVKILALTTGMSMAHEIAYTLHVTLNETPAPTPAAVAATSLKVSVSKLTLKAGASRTVSAIAAPANTTDKVVYTSQNPSVATVNDAGKITAKAAGKTKITVKAGSKEKTIAVTVTKKAVKVKSLKMKKAALTMNKGTQTYVSYKVNPTGATTTLKWKSSNKNVAAVDQTGKIVAKKAGKATITVTANGKKATVKVSVVDPCTSVKVQSALTLKAGKSAKLKVTTTPKTTGQKAAFKSSNKKVATVDSKGKVKALKKGTAKITVTVGKQKATCTVKVK